MPHSARRHRPLAPWDPSRYLRYRDERGRPFRDLLALVQARHPARVVDLGCGTGELTVALHSALDAGTTLGLDSSSEMLARAPSALPSGVSLRLGTIQDWLASRPDPVDVLFSNAALHWIQDHASLVPRLGALVAPGGELAFQVPAMDAHPMHATARRVAAIEPFATALGEAPRESPVLPPARYASLLFDAGFREQRVRLEVYAHPLPSALDAVQWARGSLLTWYEDRLGPRFEDFVDAYAGALFDTLAVDPNAPLLLTYERILAWGRSAPDTP